MHDTDECIKAADTPNVPEMSNITKDSYISGALTSQQCAHS